MRGLKNGAAVGAGGGPRRLDLGDLAAVLPRGGRVLVGACSAESLVLAEAVAQARAALGPMTLTAIFVPGFKTRTYLANPLCRVESFFQTPQRKAAGEASRFLPLCTAIVVTEQGAADLRGLDHQERARALIAIAPLLFRDRLVQQWRTRSQRV